MWHETTRSLSFLCQWTKKSVQQLFTPLQYLYYLTLRTNLLQTMVEKKDRFNCIKDHSLPVPQPGTKMGADGTAILGVGCSCEGVTHGKYCAAWALQISGEKLEDSILHLPGHCFLSALTSTAVTLHSLIPTAHSQHENTPSMDNYPLTPGF